MQQIIEYLEKKLNNPQNHYVDNSMSQALNSQPKSPQQNEENIPSNLDSTSNNLNSNTNNNNANNIKKKTLRMKQRQNLEIYLKEIGIELEEEDEELQQVIDIFVSQRITPNILKLATIEDLIKVFFELGVTKGLMTQLLTTIKASKVCENFFMNGFALNKYLFIKKNLNRKNSFYFGISSLSLFFSNLIKLFFV